MAVPVDVRCDRGATRVESIALGLALSLVVAVGAVLIGWQYFDIMGDTQHAVAPLDGTTVSTGAEPVAVSVVQAATVEQPVTSPDDDVDACGSIPGFQPHGFDCAMPLFVDALERTSTAQDTRFLCADSINYQVVGGQDEGERKLCVLKTAWS